MSSQDPPPFKPINRPPIGNEDPLSAAPIDPSKEKLGSDLSPFENSIFDSIMRADKANVRARNRPRSEFGSIFGKSAEDALLFGAASAREFSAGFLQTNLNLFAGATDLGRRLWNKAVNENPWYTIDNPIIAPDAKALLNVGQELISDPSVALDPDELARRAYEHSADLEQRLSNAEGGDRLLVGMRQVASSAGQIFGYVGGAPGAVMRGIGSAVGRSGASFLGQVAIRGMGRMGYSGAKIAEIARNGQLWAEYVSAATARPGVRFALERLEKWGLPIASGAGGFAGVSFLEGGASPGRAPMDLRGRTGQAAVSAMLSVGFVAAGGLANAIEGKIFRGLIPKSIKGEIGKAWQEKQLRGGLVGQARSKIDPGMRDTLGLDLSGASADVKKWLQGRAKWNAKIAGAVGGFMEGLGFQAADVHFYKELIPAIYQGDQDKIDSALANMLGAGLGMAVLRGRAPSQSAAWRRQFPEENMISNQIAKDLGGMDANVKPKRATEPDQGPQTTALVKAGPRMETLESADMLHRAGWTYRGALIDVNKEGQKVPSDTMQFGVQSIPGSMNIRHDATGMVIEVDPSLVKYVTGANPDKAMVLTGNDATEFYSRALFKTTKDAIEARMFLLNSPLGDLGLVEMGPNEWHSADSSLRFTYRDGEVYQQDIREGIKTVQPWKKVDGFERKATNMASKRPNVVPIHDGWLGVVASIQERHGGDPYISEAVDTLRQADNLLLYAQTGDPDAAQLLKILSDQEVYDLVRQAAEGGERAALLDMLHEITLVASGDSNAEFAKEEIYRRLGMPVIPEGNPESGQTIPGAKGTELPEPKPQRPSQRDILNTRQTRRNRIVGKPGETPEVVTGEGPIDTQSLPRLGEPEKPALLRGTLLEASLEMQAQAETTRTSRNWAKAKGPEKWKAAGVYVSLMEQVGKDVTQSALARDFNISRPKAKSIIDEVRKQLKMVRQESAQRVEKASAKEVVKPVEASKLSAPKASPPEMQTQKATKSKETKDVKPNQLPEKKIPKMKGDQVVSNVSEEEFDPEDVGEVVAQSGKRYKVAWVVEQAQNILTSHSPVTGQENPEYIQDYQPRRRGSKILMEDVAQMSRKLDPQQLLPARVASMGAPIVGKIQTGKGESKLMALSGNGRINAIKLAYKNKHASEYKKIVSESRFKHGATLKKGEEDQPVIVGVLLGDLTHSDVANFAKDAGASPVNQMSSAEKARADAQAIDPYMMRKFKPSKYGDVSAASNEEFVSEFLTALPETDQAAMYGANNKLTKEGKDRVKNAVFFKAWDDIEFAESLLNDDQAGIRRMGSAMIQSAPAIIALDQKISYGKAWDIGLKETILKAIQSLARLKRSGESWDAFFSMGNMMEELPQGAQKIAMKALLDHYQSGKRMAEFIVTAAEAAETGWGPNEKFDMFGNEMPPPNIEEVVLAAKELIDVEREKGKRKQSPAISGSQEESGKPIERGNPEETIEFGPETGAIRNPFPGFFDSLDRWIDSAIYLRKRDRERRGYLPKEKKSSYDLLSLANWIGKRHVNWLRSLDGDASPELAFQSEQVDMRAADLRGDWIGDYENDLYDWNQATRHLKLGAEKREELNRDLGAFINARAGKEDRVVQEASEGLSKTLDQLRVEQLDEMREKWGDEVAAAMRQAQLGFTDILNDGLERLQDLGETRQVGDQWLPIKGSDKPLGQVLNAKGAAAVRAAYRGDMTDPALREMVSYLMGTQPSRYPSEEKTIEKIKSWQDRESTVTGTNSYYRRSRIELPMEFLEMDPFKLLPHLLTKNAYYVAGVEKWGPGLKDLTQLIDDVGKDNPRQARAVNEFYKSYYGYMERKSGDAIASALGKYVTASKLGYNFIGAARNAAQRYINVYPYVSIGTLIEKTLEYPPLISKFMSKAKEAELLHTRSGAVKAETALTSVESDYGKVSWIVRNSLRPFTRTEKENQVFTSMAVASQFTKDMHRLLQYRLEDEGLTRLSGVGKVIDAIRYATKIANVPEKIKGKWEEATGGHVDHAEMGRAIRRILEFDSVPVETLKKVTTYLTSRSQFGLSMSTQRNWYPRHPLMRNLPLKFMVFAADFFGFTRDQFKTAFRWATRSREYGNPWPMVKLVLGAALMGSIVIAIKDWIYGTDKSAITKAIKDGNLSDVDQLLIRMGAAVSQSGLTFPLNDLVYDQSVFGTFASTIGNVSDVSVAIYQNPADLTNAYLALKDAAHREFPALKQVRAALEKTQAFSSWAFGDGDFDKRMQERNEILAWRDASRDWREMDKHPGVAGMTKTYLDRVFGNRPNYTVNEKTLRYRHARDDISWNELGEASTLIARILTDAKQDPDPKALRRAVTSIRGSLEGGGPNMVAMRDLDRFRKEIYDVSPMRLQSFDRMRELWLHRVDRVMDMAQKKAGTQVSEGARFSNRAAQALRAVPFEPLIDVAIREGPEGLRQRLERPFELFREAAMKSPEILPESFRKAWERRGRPESWLWQHFFTSRVVPRLKKAQREKALSGR